MNLRSKYLLTTFSLFNLIANIGCSNERSNLKKEIIADMEKTRRGKIVYFTTIENNFNNNLLKLKVDSSKKKLEYIITMTFENQKGLKRFKVINCDMGIDKGNSKNLFEKLNQKNPQYLNVRISNAYDINYFRLRVLRYPNTTHLDKGHISYGAKVIDYFQTDNQIKCAGAFTFY